MHKLLFVLVLFVSFSFTGFSQINQTDANGLRQGLWQKNQPNGKLLYEGNFKDGIPVGEWKRYHVGGRVKAIINYTTDSDSAFTQLYDELGNKVAQGNYLNEKKAGKWTYFSENRKVADEYFENGIKNGSSHKYYDSGEILEEVEWREGAQEGKHQVFFKNGNPFMQCKVSGNQRNGICLTYFQNGKIELEANYKNGLRQGEWKYYNEDGDALYSLIYENGELLNPEVRDSISNLQLQNMEKGKDSLMDPERYLDNPSEYMMKKNIYKQ